MAKKAFIRTFGCQMNEHDSFRMMEVLAAHGYEATTLPDEASVIVLNTCSVRKNPENKVYSELGRLRRLKHQDPGVIIAVGGCVAQQEGERILQREKGVDIVFGPDHYFRLPEMIERARRGERVLMTEWQPRPEDHVRNFVPEEWLEAGHVEGCKASIAIMKGCDNFCSYCIVPHVRGREVSREPGNIVREAESLVAQGAKEIWLLGQNVNSYQAQGADFGVLLRRVCRVEGLRRLRFTSPHPKDWSNDLADLMASEPVICNQLHLPFQAGSNRVLDLMNRRHTIEAYLEKVRYLRAAIPGIELSTDLIVGFPSETEEDFLCTLRVLEEVRFGLVFSFKYSPRPGTQAAEIPDDVPRPVKEERLQRVIEQQNRISDEQRNGYVGTVQEVLIEAAHPRERGVMNGRTEGYRPVAVGGTAAGIGDMVQVRISGIRNHWLQGMAAGEAVAAGKEALENRRGESQTPCM